MIKLVFYVDSEADPLVEASSAVELMPPLVPRITQ